MKAVAVTPGKAGSARLINTEMPVPRKNEAVVKVIRVGVCGTDSEINSGHYGQAPAGSDRLIIGHEALGVVETAVGALKRGDHVVSTVRRPCPEDCINCRKGEVDMCLTGNYLERGIKGLDGFMSEYFAEEPEYLVKIPKGLADVGVLLEPLSIVEKGISQIYQIQERLAWEPSCALVLGAGPIGLLASMIFALDGLQVHVYDIAPRESKKAKLVEKIGAEYIDGRSVRLQDLSHRLGNIDAVFEATGNSSVALTAMTILGTNGIMCLTGVSSGSGRFEICSDCLNLQLVLGNKLVFGSVNSNKSHYESGLKHMRAVNAQWPGVLEGLITRTVGIGDFNSALSKKDDDIKVVVEIGGR